MGKIKKIAKDAALYANALFYGMKKVNEEAFSPVDTNTITIGAQKEVDDHRISKALLQGEVTKEVQELIYRTYLVEREAKKYEYFSGLKAIRRDRKDEDKKLRYENSDNLKLITVQPNKTWSDQYDDWYGIYNTEDRNLGKFEVEEKHLIKIERDFNPRFPLERYTVQLVVKELDDDDNVVLDFYVSKYPMKNDMKHIYFIREMEAIMKGNRKSDILSMDRVMFETSNAYGLDDMISFKFDKIYFRDVVEFDGHYVLKFKAHAYVKCHDETEKYHSASMEEKYRTKARKDTVTPDISGSDEYRTFTCERCGKVIEYDTDKIDELPISMGRDIDDDNVVDTATTEYMDAQMAEQTFGKMLCKDCLAKYMKEMTESDLDNLK